MLNKQSIRKKVRYPLSQQLSAAQLKTVDYKHQNKELIQGKKEMGSYH